MAFGADMGKEMGDIAVIRLLWTKSAVKKFRRHGEGSKTSRGSSNSKLKMLAIRKAKTCSIECTSSQLQS